MAQTPDFITRNRFLLTNLAIILIFILTLVVLLSAYPVLLAPAPTQTSTPRPPATITPTITQTPTITLSPTATNTRRPTHSATISSTPTRTLTPTITPLPPGPPTLTPARPVEVENFYSLQTWSPEKADQLIALMADYPNTLSGEQRGEANENYYQAFQYAIFARREALLRYPDAPQADRWRWGLAFDYARTSDPRAGEYYSSILASALNQQKTSINQLSNWFEEQEPRLSLELLEIDPPEGALSAYVISIRGFGEAHTLLIETTGAYQYYPLISAFHPINPVEYTVRSADLTDDGHAEIILYPNIPTSDLVLDPPQIYSLAALPPDALEFEPQQAEFLLGVDFENNWQIDNSTGETELVFTATVFPTCPLDITRRYRWQEHQFVLINSEFELQSETGALAFCQYLVEHSRQVWGAEQSIQIIETLLPLWPPTTGTDGQPYSQEDAAELADEWRYRLGVDYARTSQERFARNSLEPLAANPSYPDSSWAKLARQFLDAYQEPEDLYRACQTSIHCDAGQALEELIEQSTSTEQEEILAYLWTIGVQPRTVGYFDFDGDEINETWFSVRHRPGEKLEFWALFTYPASLKAISFGQIDANLPRLEYIQEDVQPPIVWLDNDFSFRVYRHPGTLEPFIEPIDPFVDVEEQFLAGLDAAQEALLTGAAPDAVRQDLLILGGDPEKYCQTRWICDPYYYLLGLTYELSRDRNAAVGTYLSLWWDYSVSPYTSMARLKLRGAGLAPTLTPTTTPTITGTLVPTTTGTPATHTPTGSAAPSTTVEPSSTPETPSGETETPTLTPTPGIPYPAAYTATPTRTEVVYPLPTGS